MQGLLNILKLKSKTVNFAAVATAIVGLLKALGVEMDPAVVAAIMTLLALVMRMITSESISDK